MRGELRHIETKKLGRFDDVGRRITGDRTQPACDIGWDCDSVAVDDHSRIAFTQVYPDGTGAIAGVLMRAATRYLDAPDVPIQHVITDNGRAFYAASFAEACLERGIAQKFTRAYRP